MATEESLMACIIALWLIWTPPWLIMTLGFRLIGQKIAMNRYNLALRD